MADGCNADAIDEILSNAQKAIDEMLKGKSEAEQIIALREKLLKTTSSLSEITREKNVMEDSQLNQNKLFIAEIEKMQAFAMEGMTKV